MPGSSAAFFVAGGRGVVLSAGVPLGGIVKFRQSKRRRGEAGGGVARGVPAAGGGVASAFCGYTLLAAVPAPPPCRRNDPSPRSIFAYAKIDLDSYMKFIGKLLYVKDKGGFSKKKFEEAMTPPLSACLVSSCNLMVSTSVFYCVRYGFEMSDQRCSLSIA